MLHPMTRGEFLKTALIYSRLRFPGRRLPINSRLANAIITLIHFHPDDADLLRLAKNSFYAHIARVEQGEKNIEIVTAVLKESAIHTAAQVMTDALNMDMTPWDLSEVWTHNNIDISKTMPHGTLLYALANPSNPYIENDIYMRADNADTFSLGYWSLCWSCCNYV